MLLITGRLDSNVPYYDAENIYKQTTKTYLKHKLLILEKSGHLPMLTEPELMSEAIRKFIKPK